MRIIITASILTLLSGCSVYQPPAAQDATASTIQIESLGFMKQLVISRIDGVRRDNNLLVGVTGGPKSVRIAPGIHTLEVQAISGGTVWTVDLRLEVQPSRTYYLRGRFNGFLLATFTAEIFESDHEEPVSTPTSETEIQETPNHTPEPASTAVSTDASASVAPSAPVAHF
jgi:hypothetical protein